MPLLHALWRQNTCQKFPQFTSLCLIDQLSYVPVPKPTPSKGKWHHRLVGLVKSLTCFLEPGKEEGDPRIWKPVSYA